MSILAMGSPMRPHTLTQTDQNTVKSYLQTGRAIRSFIARDQTRNTAGMAKNGTFLPFTILPLNGGFRQKPSFDLIPTRLRPSPRDIGGEFVRRSLWEGFLEMVEEG